MRKLLVPLTIATLALTACGGTTSETTNGVAQGSSAAASQQVHKNIKNWAGSNEEGTSFTVTTEVQAPAGVDEARELMGKAEEKLYFLAVTVDNTQGSDSTRVSSASFTTPQGDLIEYTLLAEYLNYQEASQKLSDGAANRVIEVHNAFSSEEYSVAKGQKKTVILAGTKQAPAEITNAMVNGSTALEPSEKGAETDQATGAPEASEPVGSNEALADLRGTTLKGNDIRFRIYSPNYQKEMNTEMPQALNGAWGALCSVMATEDQLKETGALTQGSHVWRSMNYAQPEAGVPGLGSEASYKVYEAESLVEGGDEKCVLVHSVDPAAATATSVATIGQYVGGSELLNTVEVR